MGESGTSDIRSLVEQLGASDADRRADAAEAICRTGSAAAAIPLVRACADEDNRVRDWVVAALEDLGPPPVGVIPQLAELAGSRHPLVAYWATTLLGRAGHDAATAVPVLIRALDSGSDPAVVERAAWALGKIGTAAVAARPALEKAAGSGDDRLGRLARESLDAIGG